MVIYWTRLDRGPNQTPPGHRGLIGENATQGGDSPGAVLNEVAAVMRRLVGGLLEARGNERVASSISKAFERKADTARSSWLDRAAMRKRCRMAKPPGAVDSFRCRRHFSERHSWFRGFSARFRSLFGSLPARREAAPGRRARAARGWPRGWGDGRALPPVSLLIPPKNIFDSKIPKGRKLFMRTLCCDCGQCLGPRSQCSGEPAFKSPKRASASCVDNMTALKPYRLKFEPACHVPFASEKGHAITPFATFSRFIKRPDALSIGITFLQCSNNLWTS